MQRIIPTDEQLSNRLKTGDTEAIVLIYERFKSGLFLFCVRLLSDSSAAEDIVHDTFFTMIVEKSQLKNPAFLKSWIFTIARNKAFDLLNKKKKIGVLDEYNENVFSDESFEAGYESNERAMILEKMLDQLLPQYKEVLILREYESMKYEEIADVTGTTVSSVKSRLFKARKALMKKIEPLKTEGAL